MTRTCETYDEKLLTIDESLISDSIRSELKKPQTIKIYKAEDFMRDMRDRGVEYLTLPYIAQGTNRSIDYARWEIGASKKIRKSFIVTDKDGNDLYTLNGVLRDLWCAFCHINHLKY